MGISAKASHWLSCVVSAVLEREAWGVAVQPARAAVRASAPVVIPDRRVVVRTNRYVVNIGGILFGSVLVRTEGRVSTPSGGKRFPGEWSGGSGSAFSGEDSP